MAWIQISMDRWFSIRGQNSANFHVWSRIPGIHLSFRFGEYNLPADTIWDGDIAGWPAKMTFSKEGYETHTFEIAKEDCVDRYNDLEVSLDPAPPAPPEYPKDVTRDPYSFKARNAAEETQLKGFLGIDPPGVDIDTYLKALDLAGLNAWQDYWFKIWSDFIYDELVNFTTAKYSEYHAQLPAPPTPPLEELIEEQFKEEVDPTLSPLGKVWYDFLKALREGDEKAVALTGLSLLTAPIAEDLIMGQVPITPAGALTLSPEIVAKLGIEKLGFFTKLGIFLLKYWKKISKTVIYIMGASTLIQFLWEELLQTQGIGIWAAISNKQWDIAYEALEKARVRWKRGSFVINWFGWTSPLAWDVFKQYVSATKDQYDIYEQVIIAKSGIMDDPRIGGLVFDKGEFRRRLLAHEIPDIADLITKAMEEPAAGTLTIKPTPADAKVSVEGQIPTTGIFSAELPVATYHAVVSKFGYVSETRELEVKEKEITTWNPELTKEAVPEPKKAKLVIEVKPEDAVIEVAGHPEIAARGEYTVDPGSYTIDFSKDGYEPVRRTAYLDEAETEIVSVILTPVEVPEVPYVPPEIPPAPIPPKKATITITSNPTNAQVYINGVYQWTTTPYTLLLDAGTYIMRVQKEEYYPVEITAEVEEGETSEIPFVLEKIPEPEVPVEPYIPAEPYYPTYTPPAPYVPSIVSTPITEVPPYEYSYLYPEVMKIPGVGPVTAPTEKELLINLETTDVMPTKGRIYSIAYLDLTTPGAEVNVAVSNDERDLVDAFLSFFELGGYTKLVGYNVSFDYRYIFTKMMLYRRPSKAWKNARLRDIMQIMKQVKEEFVFGFNKPGTLDAWGKMILGKGKYGSQELILKKYMQGDFDYVKAFQTRQIELSRDLYALARFCSSEAVYASPVTLPAETSPIMSPEVMETPGFPAEKQCPVCMAFNPLTATVCEICGARI